MTELSEFHGWFLLILRVHPNRRRRLFSHFVHAWRKDDEQAAMVVFSEIRVIDREMASDLVYSVCGEDTGVDDSIAFRAALKLSKERRWTRRSLRSLAAFRWFCSSNTRQHVDALMRDLVLDAREMAAEGRSARFIRRVIRWRSFKCVIEIASDDALRAARRVLRLFVLAKNIHPGS